LSKFLPFSKKLSEKKFVLRSLTFFGIQPLLLSTLLILTLLSKVKGGCLEILYRDHGKIKFHPSIDTIPSYSFEALEG